MSQRQQYTEVHNHKSTLKQILTGIPQGSVLGPVLFLLYINDIKSSTILNVLSFADDTTAYYSGPFDKDLFDIVNRELGNLYNWLCANKLSLNIKKTNICMFSPPNSKYVIDNNFISLKNEKLKLIGENNTLESVKFLGLYLDKHITWKSHILHIKSKISKALFALSRVKNILPHDALKTLYSTLIHSHLNYGIEAWGNATSVNTIFVLQKRAIRIMNKMYYRGHTEPIFKRERILNVNDLHLLRVSLFVYKQQAGTMPKSFIHFFPSRNINPTNDITTRQQHNIPVLWRRTHFSSRLPKRYFTKVWNSIDKATRNEKRVNKFKSLLVQYYVNKYKDYVACTNRGCLQCQV